MPATQQRFGRQKDRSQKAGAMVDGIDEAGLEIIDVRLEIDVDSLNNFLATVDRFPAGGLQKYVHAS